MTCVCGLCIEMADEHERLKKLLCDTVSMMCRNSLPHQRRIRIQGVIGITVDDDDVFLVHINTAVTSRPDGIAQDTSQYSVNVKREREYPVTQQPRYQSAVVTPYDDPLNSAAVSSDHMSSMLVTESVDIKTGFMMGDGGWGDMGGGAGEDSYSDLAYPLMDVMDDSSDYKPVIRRRGRPRLSVSSVLLRYNQSRLTLVVLACPSFFQLTFQFYSVVVAFSPTTSSRETEWDYSGRKGRNGRMDKRRK